MSKIKTDNIEYKVEICKLKEGTDLTQFEKYKFKDLGYLSLTYKVRKYPWWFWHGFITIDDLKKRIGEKQYSKFCQGKREFIIDNNKHTYKIITKF